MEYTIEDESQKIIQFRDRVLNDPENYDDAEFIRLKNEKKLRDTAKRTRDYSKHIKNGRIDLIDKTRRNQLITPASELQAAYYENYKARKDREIEETDQNRGAQRIPTLESFYDDGDATSNISNTPAMRMVPTTSGIKPPQGQAYMTQQQPTPISQNLITPHPTPSPLLNQNFQQQPFMGLLNFPPPFMNPPAQQNQVNTAGQWSYEHQLQLLQNQARTQNQQLLLQQQAAFNSLSNSQPSQFMPNNHQSAHMIPYHQFQQFPPLAQAPQVRQVINYNDGPDTESTQYLGPEQQNRPLQPY